MKSGVAYVSMFLALHWFPVAQASGHSSTESSLIRLIKGRAITCQMRRNKVARIFVGQDRESRGEILRLFDQGETNDISEVRNLSSGAGYASFEVDLDGSDIIGVLETNSLRDERRGHLTLLYYTAGYNGTDEGDCELK